MSPHSPVCVSSSLAGAVAWLRAALGAALVAVVTAGPSAAQPVPLTLAEATARALHRLPALAIQRDELRLASEGEVRAAAAYDPVLRLDTRLRSRTDPLNTLFVGAPPGALAPRHLSVAGSASWSRLFASGATVTGSASTSVEQTNSRFALLTPAYFTTLGVEVRQPVLAGRRIDAQRRALRVSALDSSRSRAALDRLVSETVAAVERAYWGLLAARDDVRIREHSLTLAGAQRDDTAVRVEAGIAAEAEMAAPRAEIARRRAELVGARDVERRADLALRALMAGTADGPDWSATFELTDAPAAPPPVEPVERLVAEALTRRPEVADIDAAREIAAVDTALARERTRTQLDLVAAYNLRGLTGGENRDLFVPFPNTTIVVPDAQQGGLDDSLQTLATHRFADVWVGVSVALPVGRRAARADMVAATLLERRVSLQRDQIAQRVATEVRLAAAALVAARERLEAAASLEAAAVELLDAERARYDTGQSSNFFVLTRQTELAQASLALATARVDAARAATELHRATGQLLERRGIQVETSRPRGPPRVAFERTAAMTTPASCAVLVALVALGSCRQGPPDDTLRLNGRVEAPLVDLAPRLQARVLDVRVREGDRVKAGDLLVRLDLAEVALAPERDAQSVAAAEARVRDLSSGSRSAEIAAADAERADRVAALSLARQEHERQALLRSRKVGTQRDLDRARSDVARAEAAVTAATERLRLVRQGFRQWQTRQAEAELGRARQIKAQSDITVREAELRAPSDGVVLHRLVEPGSLLGPGQPALTLGLESRLYVRTFVPEPHLGRVRQGQAVQVTVDSFPGQQFPARVTEISPTAEFTPKAVETRTERVNLVYAAKVDLDAGWKAPLVPGQPAQVVVVAAPASGAPR